MLSRRTKPATSRSRIARGARAAKQACSKAISRPTRFPNGPRSKRQLDAISSNPVPEVAPPHGLDQGRIRQEELIRQLVHSLVAEDFEAQLQNRDEPRKIALIRKQVESHLRRDSRIGSAEADLTARMSLVYLDEERRDSPSEGMPGSSVNGGEPNVNTGAFHSR